MKRSEHLQDYLKIYKNGLLNDTLPFWINNCIDQKHGGFTFCLGRETVQSLIQIREYGPMGGSFGFWRHSIIK